MDCVGVIIIGDQDILISLAWCNWEPSCLFLISFPERSTVLKKKILVSSDCVDGGNWSFSVSSFEWITFSCVDMRPFRGCWRFPSIVDCFFTKCLCTKSNDRLGQEVKKFFCDLFPPSRLSGDPAGCVVIVHQCAFWLALVGAPCKIFVSSRGLRH